MKPKKKKWEKNFFNYCGITYFDLNKLLEAKQEDDFKEFRNTIISDSLHESIPNFTGQSVRQRLQIYLTEQTFTCPTNY